MVRVSWKVALKRGVSSNDNLSEFASFLFFIPLVNLYFAPWVCGVSVVIGFCQTENSGTIVKLFIT